MSYEIVILVDENDHIVGTMEKIDAHRSGKLHRAISVFVFNAKGELLLQQRAHNKYHSGGKWSNTCCSHPRPGEQTKDAAQRRLSEEMGLSCELEPAFNFIYNAELDNGLSEHEYDHVYIGTTSVEPQPNKLEVAAYKYLSLEDIESDLTRAPEKYTIWFRICFERVIKYYKELQDKKWV